MEKIQARSPVKAKRITLDELFLLKENIGRRVIMDRLEYADEVVLKDIEYFQHNNDYYITHFIAVDRERDELYPVDETRLLMVRRASDERLLWYSLSEEEDKKENINKNPDKNLYGGAGYATDYA